MRPGQESRFIGLGLLFMVVFGLSSTDVQAQFAPMCSYTRQGASMQHYPPQPATPLVYQMVQRITSLMNIPPLSVFQIVGMQNASATRDPRTGAAVILYDPGFFDRMHWTVENRGLASSGQWATFSVLAHEVGHHFHGDASFYQNFQHPWDKELRADYFSGVVLRRAGASLRDAHAAILTNFDPHGSPSHPDTRRRLDAITAGYYRG